METTLIIVLIAVSAFGAIALVLLLRILMQVRGALARTEAQVEQLQREMIAQEERMNMVIAELENKPTDPLTALAGIFSKYGLSGWSGVAGNIAIKLLQSFISRNKKEKKRKALPSPAETTETSYE